MKNSPSLLIAKRSILVAHFSFFLWYAIIAQAEQGATATVQSMYTNLARLISSHSKDPNALESLKTARSDLDQIVDHYLNNYIALPSDYAEMLLDDSELISLETTRSEDELLSSEVNDAFVDLNVKASFARKQRILGASPLPPTNVHVEFTTFKESQKADGYLVRCNHRRFVNEDNPKYIFNDPTSPASGELLPGAYFCFFVQNNSIIWRQQFRIGMDGKSSDSIRVSLP